MDITVFPTKLEKEMEAYELLSGSGDDLENKS